MKNRLDAYLASFEITMYREVSVERLKLISLDQRNRAVSSDIRFFVGPRETRSLLAKSSLLLEEGGRLGVTFLSPFRPRNPRPQIRFEFFVGACGHTYVKS